MAENTVFLKKYLGTEEGFSVNENEIWRYSGYPGGAGSEDEGLRMLLSQVMEEMKDIFSYRVCYRRMPIGWENGMPMLPFPAQSKDLAKCLGGSGEIVIFAATVGFAVDRAIAKYQKTAPTKALLMQAYGAERVERLCDVFCGELREEAFREGLECTPRFSPGYGDLPLAVQREVTALLDCSRQIGIVLNESLLMSPSKSVTAIFGLGTDVRKKEA